MRRALVPTEDSRTRTLFGSVEHASVLVTSADLDRLSPLFPEERPSRSWVEKREREYRAGRHVAREVLARLGHPNCVLPKDADGLPLYPEGIRASLAHTGRERTFAIAAASRTHLSLGIDVEERQTLSNAVREQIMSDEELALFPERLAPSAALVTFSAKEAFYKAVFPHARRFLGFADVLVRRVDADLEEGVIVLEAPSLAEKDYVPREARFALFDERIIALAVR